MSYVPMKGLPANALDRVTYHGRTLDRLTLMFLLEMEERLGYPLTVVQGSYNTSVLVSGTTHKLGGVVDLAAYKWEEKVRVGADLGAFIYHRDELPGTWGEHIHMGIRNHPLMDPMAIRQQEDWDHKPPLNGLASHAPLTGQYHPHKQIQFNYKEAVVAEMTPVQKMRDSLVAGIHEIQQAIAFAKDTSEKRVVVRNQIPKLREVRRDAKEILELLPPR